MKVDLRDADVGDLEAIVRIHHNAFPHFFLTKMGKQFLMQYYRGYLDKKEVLLIAVDVDNKIVGFVAGLKDSEDYYRYLKKIWYRFFPPVVLALLNVELFVTAIQRIYAIFRSNKVNEKAHVPEGFHELTSIGVSPEVRQYGVGKLLMNTYLDAVKSLPGVKGVYLTTDFEDNEHVHRFYKSMGFQMTGKFMQNSKRQMSAYILILN
jgi:ribosomal protein S18 acetylase RimI-like enzyme